MWITKFRPRQLDVITHRNREELVAHGVTRRDLAKMGLLTSAGLLIPKVGLGDCGPGACQLGCSPPTRPFLQPLRILPVLPERAVTELNPAPTVAPNRNINPATGLPFEGRTEPHQFRDRFPAQKFFMTRMGAVSNGVVSPDLPAQNNFWGFNLGGADLVADPPQTPGPLVVSRYLTPILVRRHNALPAPPASGGFGVPEVSTHLHNFHSAPDSDGGPCDPVQQRFFFRGQYYDYFYNMQWAGFDSTHPPNGDIRETLSTLWYHDHRVDHTAENAYKGLAGMLLIFNDFDTGNEATGFHFPTFPDFDIPLVLTDKLFNATSGQLCFDTFGFDGLIGDKNLVNGRVQPFLDVSQRRYRFRILDAGPSRFYQFFLTNPDNPSQSIPFHLLTNDGNLLEKPIRIFSQRIAVAERVDIIIDFKKIAQQFGATRLWLENRLEQVNGRAPTDNILPPGQIKNVLMEFRLGAVVTDGSVDPEVLEADPRQCVFSPICLPTNSLNDPNAQPRITRTFRFERGNGQWQINGRFMDCTQFRFTVQRNSIEKWILQNNSGGWQHPIHIHLEELQILKRNGVAPPATERSRKDVVRLGFNEQIELFFRFRDYRGGYPIHCHNTVHEDHAMMMIWQIQDVGDNNRQP